MFIKIFLSCYLISFGLSIPLEHDYDLPAKYEFSYAVHDEHTGDIKSQQESRNGHAVQGRYELIDSDGYRRIVEYTADKHSGFNAIVHREPTDIKIPLPVQQQHSQKFLTSEGPYYPAPFTKVSFPSAISNIATSVHSQPNTIYHQLS